MDAGLDGLGVWERGWSMSRAVALGALVSVDVVLGAFG